jgi:ComF family protein
MKRFFDRLFSLIFPKNCLICNKIIPNAEFCFDDWNRLSFLQNPACKVCFMPFEFHVDEQMVCAKCFVDKPQYFKAISVLKYDDASGILISKFKYSDQTYLAKYFSKLMINSATEILPDVDFITCVPLHKFRIIKRKYNQSALLAKNIADLSNKKLITNLLVRIKNNKPQASLPQMKRIKNVQGIFKVTEKYLSKIKDKNILLIDDVITTGSTINSCAKALKKAGANKVYVLSLAKTVFH